MTVGNEYTTPNYSLRRGRGGTIVLPQQCLDDLVNLHVPSEADLFTESSTQEYPLGTKLYLGDNIFRYIRAGTTLPAANRGFLKYFGTLCPGSGGNSSSYGFEGAMSAATAANATSFTIADTAAAKNLYEGATLVIYDDTNNSYQQYRVIGNDVTNATTTTLYIAEPGFKYANTTSFGITIYLSPYYNINTATNGGGYASAAGFVRMAMTSGYYAWMVTAGPVSSVTGASTWPGQTQYYRDVYANSDGSVIGYNAGWQRIGYLLSKTASDYGDNFIMLQLDQ